MLPWKKVRWTHGRRLAAANATDLALVRADRAYQIAAAYFHTGEFTIAQEAFEAIAKDSSWPYQQLAAYLAARAPVRKGTLNNGDEEYHSDALAQAEAQLRAILADKNLAEMHDSAERLLGFVRVATATPEWRTSPEELLATADQALYGEKKSG